MLVPTRYADYIQGAFQLLHVLVQLVILLSSSAPLSEPCAGDIDGRSRFLIPEKHSRRTFPQMLLTFLK